MTSTAFSAANREERSKWWRSVLGEYPTGIAIVSALDAAGVPQGLVVGTFSSVSLDPPLVTFMPMRTSRAYTAIADCDRFRVSVLGAAHEDLCRSFAAAPPESRFEVGNWVLDGNGIPHLTDALVWFDCVRTQTIEAGDHDIVLGEVQDLGHGDGSAGMPMLFLKGGYGAFTMPRLDFDATQLGTHLRAAELMRPAVRELTERIGASVTLCSLAQDSVVVLTATNPGSDPARPEPVGASFPFAAPLGVVFAAWDDGARRALWRKAGLALGFTDDDVIETMVRRVRERGYAISVGATMAEQFERVSNDPAKGKDELARLWSDIARDHAALAEEPGWEWHVNSVQVPIFGSAGTPDLALAVSGLANLTPERLEEIVGLCQHVADELREMIGGIRPQL